jgi:hypothetical protein
MPADALANVAAANQHDVFAIHGIAFEPMPSAYHTPLPRLEHPVQAVADVDMRNVNQAIVRPDFHRRIRKRSHEGFDLLVGHVERAGLGVCRSQSFVDFHHPHLLWSGCFVHDQRAIFRKGQRL